MFENRHSRIIAWVALLAALALLLCAALAEGGKTGSISLTVRNTRTGLAVSGGSVTLRRVATVAADGTSFEYTPEFAGCGASLEDLSSEKLVEKLAAYVENKGIEGETKAVSDAGEVSFSGLELGLYLLVQETPAENFVALSPFLVTIPMRVNGTLVYDVNATPKAGSVSPTVSPSPSPSPSPKPASSSGKSGGGSSGGGSSLPQTGQLWWPVPALVCLGLALISLGQFRRKRR